MSYKSISYKIGGMIVKRNDVSKSKIFLDCLIKGSAPNLIDMINAKRLVIDKVNSQQE